MHRVSQPLACIPVKKRARVVVVVVVVAKVREAVPSLAVAAVGKTPSNIAADRCPGSANRPAYVCMLGKQACC